MAEQEDSHPPAMYAAQLEQDDAQLRLQLEPHEFIVYKNNQGGITSLIYRLFINLINIYLDITEKTYDIT